MIIAFLGRDTTDGDAGRLDEEVIAGYFKRLLSGTAPKKGTPLCELISHDHPVQFGACDLAKM
jgi:hypothetical protein